MTPLTRPRFGIRALLVLVAIVAISAYIFRCYRNLHNAREELQRIMANYEAMRVTAQDVVNASKKLMTAESGTLWISKRAATGAHVERLKNLLNKLQSPVSESEPQEIQRRVEFIQQELHDISD
jgi:hypothetical protein